VPLGQVAKPFLILGGAALLLSLGICAVGYGSDVPNQAENAFELLSIGGGVSLGIGLVLGFLGLFQRRPKP
jgi:hypothetical protein